MRFLKGFKLLCQTSALLGGWCCVASAAGVQFHFLTPTNYSSIKGSAEFSVSIDTPLVTSTYSSIDHVDYTLDGSSGKVLATAKWVPQWASSFYAQADVSKITPGVHSIGATVYDKAGHSYFQYVMVYINTVATSCPDLNVEIRNLSRESIVGGAEGYNDGTGGNNALGSAGWFANPYSTIYVGVPAGFSSSPRSLEVNVQLVNNNFINTVTCKGHVRTLNSCPATGAIAIFGDTGVPANPLYCSLYTY